MENAKLINKELERKYGSNLLKEPFYRIVQNFYSMSEKRKGMFANYAGDILLPATEDIRNVPKYNYLPEGIWILEKLMEYDNPELLYKKSYEIMWAFTGKKEDNYYQAPNLRACIFLIESSRKGGRAPEMTEQERLIFEENLFYEMLGGKPGLDGSVKSGEAISYAGLNAKEKFNG